MMTLLRSRWTAVCCLALVTVPSAVADTRDPEIAVQIGFLYSDFDNRRLFVVPPDGALASKTAATQYLRKAAVFVATYSPDWGDDWNVSFFSSWDLAGYETKFMKPRKLRATWRRAYLAEFSRRTGRLTYAPKDKKRLKHDMIELE